MSISRKLLSTSIIPHKPTIMIIAIEFDGSAFADREKCHAWLEANGRDYILKIKGFRLRSKSRGEIISHESRPVWSYKSSPWKYRVMALTRPEPYVAIVESQGTEIWGPVDIPPLMPSTMEKNQRRSSSQQEEKARSIPRRAEGEEEGGEEDGSSSGGDIDRKDDIDQKDDKEQKETPRRARNCRCIIT